MYKPRLDALADGIFAIVMTLLVLEIRVPHLVGRPTDAELMMEFKALLPLFASYVLSFLVLATYWIGHHFIVSVYAKNLPRKLVYLNIPFLMFVAVVPFSANFLGAYPYSQLAVILYGLNVIVIGLCLFSIIDYVVKSDEVENIDLPLKDIHFGYIRVILPIISAVIAILLSFINTYLSVYIFIFTVLYTIIPGAVSGLDRFIHSFTQRHSSEAMNPSEQ